MTTRHEGYVVTLEENIREDDAELIINALKFVKGVLSVTPVNGDVSLAIAEQRAKMGLYNKFEPLLRDLLR